MGGITNGSYNPVMVRGGQEGGPVIVPGREGGPALVSKGGDQVMIGGGRGSGVGPLFVVDREMGE